MGTKPTPKSDEDPVTRGEFRDFRDNHFHDLETKVAKIAGSQVVLIMMVGVVVTIVGAILAVQLLG